MLFFFFQKGIKSFCQNRRPWSPKTLCKQTSYTDQIRVIRKTSFQLKVTWKQKLLTSHSTIILLDCQIQRWKKEMFSMTGWQLINHVHICTSHSNVSSYLLLEEFEFQILKRLHRHWKPSHKEMQNMSSSFFCLQF